MRTNTRVAAVLAGAVAACGGGGGGTGPTNPPTPAPPGHQAAVVLFQDENANGTLEVGEALRVPDVEVSIAGRTGRSAPRTGVAELADVSAGTHAVNVRPETLPPFYRAGSPVTITVPMTNQAAPIAVPLILEAHPSLRRTQYVAFGDSVTRGENVPVGSSYPAKLQARLAAHFGFATVNNRGADATNSFEAVERLNNNVAANQPAYTLILYGTNDWNTDFCQGSLSCPTTENLRRVVRFVKGIGSLPFLATIPPVNPLLQPQQRNDWIDGINAQLKEMARQEGAFVVDLNEVFDRQPSLPALFDDHVHPNVAGYELIANAFFEAIAHGRSVP